MSDGPFYPEYKPRKVGDIWSLKKIVEQVTGKPLSSFQDPVKTVRPEPDYVNPPPPRAPPVTSFLARPDPDTLPTLPELDAPPRRVLTYHTVSSSRPSHRSPADLERKYLAYLMLHLDSLSDPALRYLRQAVEEEYHGRGGEQRKPTRRARR